jgi:hypothetical protein
MQTLHVFFDAPAKNPKAAQLCRMYFAIFGGLWKSSVKW